MKQPSCFSIGNFVKLPSFVCLLAVLLSLSIGTLNAQAVGDYGTITSGSANWVGGTWSVCTSAGTWTGATTTTTAPTSSTNVWVLGTCGLSVVSGNPGTCANLNIASGANVYTNALLTVTGNILGGGTLSQFSTNGVTMTGSGKSITSTTVYKLTINPGAGNTITTSGAFNINGNLTVSTGTFSLGGTIYYGANASSGISIASGATLNTVSNATNLLFIQGSSITITNNGTFGASSYAGANTGPYVFTRGVSTLLITGTGTANLCELGSDQYTTSTAITIDQSMTLSNTGEALTLEAWGNSAGASDTRSLTINAGKTVTIKNGWFHMNATTSSNNMTPNTYNINGTLDVSLGSIGLVTTTSSTVGAQGTTNSLTVNVGAAGTMICGTTVDVIKLQAGQTLAVNVAAGGTISYAGTSYTTTQGAGTTNSLLTATNQNLTFTNTAAVALLGSVTVSGNLTAVALIDTTTASGNTITMNGSTANTSLTLSSASVVSTIGNLIINTGSYTVSYVSGDNGNAGSGVKYGVTVTTGTLSLSNNMVFGTGGTSTSAATVSIASGASFVTATTNRLFTYNYTAINNNGTFGYPTNTSGKGINVTIFSNNSLSLTGTGVSYLTSMEVDHNSQNAQVTIGQNVYCNSTSGVSFSLEGNNGDAASNGNARSLTINAGATVTLNSGAWWNLAATFANTASNNTYNINGTLDLNGASAGLWTTTNTTADSRGTQNILAVNIGASGKLKLGTVVDVVNSQPATQAINISVTAGGTIVYSGTSYTATQGSGTTNSLLTTSNSNLTFTSSSATTIALGSNNLTANNLTLGAATTLSGSGNTTVNGTLTFAGLLTNNTGTVTLGSSAVLSGNSTTNYIDLTNGGALVRNGVTSTGTLFPIGIGASNYTPLTLTNTTNTPNITVKVKNTFDNAVQSSTKVVLLQWSVVGSAACTSDIVYQFNSGNKAASFNVAGTCDLGNYTSGAWATAINVGTPSGSNPYTLSKTGLAIPTSTNLYVVGNTGQVVPAASGTTTWNGAAGDNSWTNTNNWNNGVPDNTIDVTIPTGSPNYPILTTSQGVHNLTIASSASIANTSGTITIVGSAISNNGTISGAGSVVFNASSVTQTITGTGTISNITVNNSAGVTNSGTLTISGSVTIASGILSGTAPIYSSTIPVTYTGTATTGKELTPSSGTVSSLTINASTTVTLGGSVSVGSLVLAGTMADGGFTLTSTGGISGTGTHTGTGEIKMTGTGTISGAITLVNLEIAAGSNTVTVTTAPSTIQNLIMTSGTLSIGANELLVTGNLTGYGTISGTGRVNLSSASAITIGSASGTLILPSVVRTGAATITAAGNIVINGDYEVVSSVASGGYVDGGFITAVGGNVINSSSTRYAFTSSGSGLGIGKVSMLGQATASGLLATGSITSGGSGFVTGDIVQFNSGTYAIAAKGTVTASGGVVTAITITDAGASYTVAPTSFSKVSGSGSGTCTVSSALIATSTSTKYLGIGLGGTLYTNLELSNTVSNNTYSFPPSVSGIPANTNLFVQGALSFATSGSSTYTTLSVLGLSGGNTSGTIAFTSSSTTLYIGGSVSNTNNASAASITMASTNYFKGNSSGTGYGNINPVSTTALGTIYFSPTNNYINGITMGGTNQNSGDLTIGNDLIVAGSINMGSNATSNTGKIIVASGGSITLPTSITAASSASTAKLDVSTNSTATLKLASAISVPSGFIYNNAASNVSVTNAAPTLNSALSISNTLTLNATTSTSYSLTTNGYLTMGSGSNVVVNQTGTGTQNLSAIPTFSGTVNYTYTGTNAITMGNEVPTATGVANNLTINNAAGVTLNQSNDLTVNGALTFTSGKVTLGNSNLSLAGTASVSSANTSNYAVVSGTGILTWNGLSSASKLFPIGTSSYYAPLTIANTTGTSNVSASVGTSLFTVADATKVVGLKWSVIGSAATTATVIYQFNASNKRASFNIAGTCDLGVYDGTNYTTLSAGTPTGSDPYTATVAGLSVPNSTNLNDNQFVVGNTGNVVPVTVTRLTWTGTNSTSWTDAGNWDYSIVPDATYDVTIPSSLVRYPNVTASQQAKSLTINSGATIAITSGGSIDIDGAIVNNGSVTGAGFISLSGASTQNLSGTGSINNLTILNASAVLTGSNQTITNLTLNGASIAATGTLTIPNGGTVTVTSGNITGTGLVYGSGGVAVIYNGVGTTTSAKEIAPSSGVVSSLTINGTGTYTIGSNATVQNIAITSGILADGGNTLTVTGNLSVTSAHTGTGMISMTSASNTAIISGSGTLTNLEIAAGSNTVNVSSAPTSIASLAMTSGTLSIGTNELVVNKNITGTGTVSGTGRIKIASVTTATVSAQGSTSTTVTLASTNSNIVVGQYVTGYGVPLNVTVPITVSAISGLTLTLSSATTVALPSNSTLYFSNTAHTLGSSSGTLTLPNLAIGSSGAVTLAGNVTVNGDIATLYSANNNGSGSYYNQITPATYTLTCAGNLLNFENGRLNFASTTGKISMSGTATGSGVVSYTSVSSAGSSLTANVATVTFTGGSPVIAARGLVTTVTGGAVSAITITDPGVGYSSVPTGYSIDGTGSTGTVTGAVIGNTTSAKYISGSMFVNNLELANTVASNTVTMNSNIYIGSSFSFTGGNSTGGFGFSGTPLLQIGAVVSNPNNPSSATVTMASTNTFIGGTSFGAGVGQLWYNSSASNIGSVYVSSTNNYIWGMRIDNSSAVTFANSVAVTSALTLNGGTITLGSGANFSIYPTTITRVSGVINASNANATVTLAGATTAPASLFSPATIGNLVITNSAPTLSQAITVSNSLTLNSTTATSYTIANGSNITIGSGASIVKNKTGSGKMSLAVVPTFTSLATNSFSYLGSKLDTIGNEMPASANTIAALTINNTGNVNLNGYDITTSGALTLTAGNLVTGNNNVIAGSVSGGLASSYVLINGAGTLKSSASNGVAKLYPVGTRIGYTPVTITPSATQVYSIGLANNAYTTQPGDTTQVLKVQWNVLGTTSATTASVKFGYNTSLFSSAYTVSASEVGNDIGTGWVIPASAGSILPTTDSTGYYSVTASGLSIPISGRNNYVIGNTGNVVVLTTTWLGLNKNDVLWSTATNWDNGVPTSATDAVIPATSYKPVINAASATKSLTVAANSFITNNSTLSISGTSLAFNANGYINGGTSILNGTAKQTISGTGSVAGLTLNNSAGATISSGSNNLGVSGILTLQSGLLTTNGNLTFKSTSIANTGVLAPYGASGNTGTISGTVTVERYIPAGYRAYRDMATEVYNSTLAAGSMFKNWQENGSFTSGNGIFISGHNAIDASKTYYNAAQSGFDATSGIDNTLTGAASAYVYHQVSSAYIFDSIQNTKSTILNPFTGYRVLIRGDRSFNLESVNIPTYGTGATYASNLRMINATTLRATGQLVTGTVTYSSTGVTNTVTGTDNTVTLNNTVNGFSLVANPYVAPVQWGTGTGTNSSSTTVFGASSNVNGSIWYLDPTSNAVGKYIAYNAQTGAAVSGYTSTSSVIGTGYIQPGQAVFIQTSAASPTVVFKETAKATSSTKTAVFGATSPLSKIYVSLNKLNTSTNGYDRVDGAAIAFNEGFTNDAYGPQDALKFGNANDNLYISDKGKNLSIDGRLPATATDKLPIAINKVSGTNYQLVVDATNYTSNGFAPYLIDSYRGTVSTLTNGTNTITFTADASVAATFSNRFSIAFKPTTLAVNSIVASATLNNKIATISWNTVGEKGVSRFEVEKSTDAKSFAKIGQSTAKNTATAAYTTTDNSVTATTYYRIKAISEVGTVSYSNLVQLAVSSKQFTVYPNPLVGKVLTVSFGNISAGKYTVTITNVLGQKVQEASISHAGGSASHAITITGALAAGSYSVTVRGANGQTVYQSNLAVQQ